jgi:hypothetical protein
MAQAAPDRKAPLFALKSRAEPGDKDKTATITAKAWRITVYPFPARFFSTTCSAYSSATQERDDLFPIVNTWLASTCCRLDTATPHGSTASAGSRATRAFQPLEPFWHTSCFTAAAGHGQ